MYQREFQKTVTAGLVLCITLIFMVFAQSATGTDDSLVQLSESLFQEKKHGRVWQVKRSKRIKTIHDATTYINKLNKGEYNNWRLPTKQELVELFSVFDLKDNGNVMIRLEGSYWLAENQDAPYVGSLEIGDQCGPSRTFYKGKAGYVRAVRP